MRICKNHSKITKSGMYFAIASLITACGGTGQDKGTFSVFSQIFSGIALDGALARATVFIDSNNNGTRDSWEDFAFTDNDGYYSYNPRTDTNYCADDASPQQRQYCLVSTVEYGDVVVRIDYGYDTLTGEPFVGQLSRRVDAQIEEEVSGTVVSPFTSLMTNIKTEDGKNTLLSALQMSEDELDIDYLDIENSGNNINPSLLNSALKIHKVVSVLSDRLTDTYVDIGEEIGTPNDASSSVYPNLAEQIINAQSNSEFNLHQALSDKIVLVSALDGAENSLRKIYDQKELPLPADMGNAENTGSFERVVDVSSQISNVVDQVIDIDNPGFNQNNARGGARALETVIIKSLNEKNDDDTSIENVIDFFNTGDSVLVETLLASLSSETADITTLAKNDFSGDDFDSEEEIASASVLGEDVRAFTQVGGLQIKISDLDLGNRPTKSDDSEIELYFSGEPDDIDGSFTACVKHIDDADETTGNLGEGNTRGELVEGFWSLLGARYDRVESYSILITLTFLGTTYQAIMKPAGAETIAATEYRRIRFDNDGELSVWHSQQGFTDQATLPDTNIECQNRLPPRIDI